MVKIIIPQPMRQHTDGNNEIKCEGSTVSEVLLNLDKDYPALKERIKDEDGKIRRFINIFVNGKDIRLSDGEDTPLKEDDEISILPAIAGG